MCLYFLGEAKRSEATDMEIGLYTHIRKALLDNITNLIDDKLIDLLLYGDNIHSVEVNSSILKYTLIFLKPSKGTQISPQFS